MWENEILVRENATLESFLQREKETSLKEDGTNEPPFTASSKKRATNKAGRRKGEKINLPLDKKIYIAEKEIRHRKQQLADMEEDFQKESINFKAMIKETEMRITEIKKEAYEFKRVVLAKGADKSTGKFRAEYVIKYYDDKIKQKDALVEKLEAKNVLLQKEITKMERQLKNKDHSGESLSPIDFYQLEIENKSFSQKIEEKNKALLKLKVSTAKLGQNLTEKRNLLQKLLEDSVELKKAIVAAEQREQKLKEEYKKIEDLVARNKRSCNKLKLAQTVSSDMPQIQDYVNQKDTEFELKKKIRQWETKCQLAANAARRAKAEAARASQRTRASASSNKGGPLRS